MEGGQSLLIRFQATRAAKVSFHRSACQEGDLEPLIGGRVFSEVQRNSRRAGIVEPRSVAGSGRVRRIAPIALHNQLICCADCVFTVGICQNRGSKL